MTTLTSLVVFTPLNREQLDIWNKVQDTSMQAKRSSFKIDGFPQSIS